MTRQTFWASRDGLVSVQKNYCVWIETKGSEPHYMNNDVAKLLGISLKKGECKEYEVKEVK